MAEGDRTCNQLREILAGMDLLIIKDEEPSSQPSRKRRREETEEPIVVEEQAASTQTSTATRGGRRRLRGGGKAVAPSGTPIPSGRSQVPAKKKFVDPKFSTDGSRRVLTRLLGSYFKWRGVFPKFYQNLTSSKSKSSMSFNQSYRGGRGSNFAGRGANRGGSTAHVRRRVRGSAKDPKTSDAADLTGNGNEDAAADDVNSL
jgi:hypothetical protein